MALNNGLFFQLYSLITLVFCGVVQYFTGIGAVLWLPFMLAFVMAGLLLMQTRYADFSLDTQEVIVLTLFIGFFAMAVLSTFLQNGAMITIVGLKNELALSLVMGCLLLGFCGCSQLYRIIRLMHWVFYVQFPVVLFQVLVIVPKRVAFKGEFEKWDSVVGTFGGDPMGGGNTAAMGLFCLFIMLIKFSEYKHGVASRLQTGLHIGGAFILCVLGEIKFVILLSPLLMVFIWFAPAYMTGMKRYDWKIILMILGGMAGLLMLAVFVLGASYASAFGANPNKSALDLFISSLDYVFDPDYIMPSGELGRMTTFFFWAGHSDLYGWPSQWFGYGLNATNHGSAVAPGFLNLIFNVLLDSTSLSMMLWELGLAGTLFFIILVFYSIRVTMPRPVFEPAQLTWQDRRLLSWQPALIAFAIAGLLSLPYSQILMLTPMLQFLFYFALGAMFIIRKSVLTVSASCYESKAFYQCHH
ncbi:capsular biosynthesis protein [Vibrio quintilis]|uniref:Capsular biosynthesis protein n=1 Tax=Vibrio quintilis TaxID=1117707 RepID=A0A1M7Z158_9VIBR|nr:capsular biosynthesis protein [Vibrio quintilis]SHO58593.1 hypothetical protein VQ7734_04365 [Vibrio quintilis]